MNRSVLVICMFNLLLSGFTATVAIGDTEYFTERFSSTTSDSFDLANKSIMFIPTADGTSYTPCLKEITNLPTDPYMSTYLSLDDDDYVFIDLGTQSVSIFGNSFTGFYVNSNGNITFTEGDEEPEDNLRTHFSSLRISALFQDLDPTASDGLISLRQFEDHVAVTWQNIPEYEYGGANTAQAEMYFDGRIQLAWLRVNSRTNIVGLSNGFGLQADFQETNFSAYPQCGSGSTTSAIISGYVRTLDGAGIPNVLLTFSNNGGSAVTGSTGFYSNVVTYGWSGVAVPSKTGYTFDPVSISYNNVITDLTNQNYAGFIGQGQQTSFLTEVFSSTADTFDLSNKAIIFTPSQDGTTYNACLQTITHLPTLPTGGSNVSVGDDDYELVSLNNQQVSIFGRSFTEFYIGSNGYITFTDGDTEYSASTYAHFSTLRISALFIDLNPASGGISWKQLEDRVAVTWQEVPSYGSGGSNTFQVEMFFNGVIRLAWLGVSTQIGIVGLSGRFDTPMNFQETDLSAYPLCGGGSPTNPVISGYVRAPDGSGIRDVLMTFGDDGGTVTTDSTGYYSNAVWSGWIGIVRPSKIGYYFNPPSISYSNVTSNMSQQNYTGIIGSPPSSFTQLFSDDTGYFDLLNLAVLFTPTADGSSYSACLQKISQLPTNPAGGTNLALNDDDYEPVSLSSQKTVSIFGSTYSTFYVGSNGYITFTMGDTQSRYSISDHFNIKRISVLFNDFDPTWGGTVSWKQLSDRVAVTWLEVPRYHPIYISPPNTFQVEMFFNGRIRLSWLEVDSQTGIVGLSDGLSSPENFQNIDFSTAFPLCEGGPTINPIISGYVRTTDGSGLSDVLLTFSNNGGTTTTNSSGYYGNTVLYDWSGVVTPSKSGYTFTPPSISYSNVASNISEQNYTGMTAVSLGFFTEQFSSSSDPFDLSNKTVIFTPTTDGTSYDISLQDITSLPTDPAGGTQLALADDSFVLVSLNNQKTVLLYGSSYPGFYVGSNGYITFTAGDREYRDTLSFHFALKRISVLFRDFDPSRAGTVSWKQLSNRVVVTWQGIPTYNTSSSSTFQVEMYFNGKIQLAWLAVATNMGIVGLSKGLGVPADFQEIDFSQYQQGQPPGPTPGEQSPIAHWTMDDNANDTTVLDSSERGNHGTAQRNTSTLSVAGIIDSALSFNGVSDYISVPDDSEWTFNGDFTITIWAKYNTFNPKWWESAFIAHDEGPGNNKNKWIFSYDPGDSKTLFHINRAGTGGPVIKGNQWAAQAGVWYFIAVTRSGSKYTFYKEGISNGTQINATVIPNVSAPLTIGWAEEFKTFDGALDNIRIYNRALSDAEITALYSHGVLQHYIEAETGSGLIGSWSILNDTNASGGQYIKWQGATSAASPPSDNVTYSFNAPMSGLYKVYLRVNTNFSTASDSFWVKIDGADVGQSLNITRSNGWVNFSQIVLSNIWTWNQVRNSESFSRLVEFYLPEGAHTLRLGYREPTPLDMIYITNTDTGP